MPAQEPPEVGAVRERARAAAGGRDALVAEAEAAVVTWRWARNGSGFHRPEPLYTRRVGLPLGAWTDAPEAPGDEEQCGLDAQGRIVLAREWTGGSVGFVEVFEYDDDRIRGTRFDPAGVVVDASELSGPQGRPAIQVSADAGHQYIVERYTWEGDQLRRVDLAFDASDPAMPDVKGTQFQELRFDVTGDLVSVTETDDRGRTSMVYRRRGEVPSTAEISRTIEERLVEGIAIEVEARCGAAGGGRKLTRVALQYEAEDPVPPWIALGFAGADDFWDPAEFHDPASDPEPDSLERQPNVREAWTTVVAEDAELAPARGRDLLNRVARRLNERGWPGVETADDVVVYAVDMELEHLDANLRDGVPSGVLKRLVARYPLP